MKLVSVLPVCSALTSRLITSLINTYLTTRLVRELGRKMSHLCTIPPADLGRSRTGVRTNVHACERIITFLFPDHPPARVISHPFPAGVNLTFRPSRRLRPLPEAVTGRRPAVRVCERNGSGVAAQAHCPISREWRDR